jgi:hypothetical protein
MAEPLSPSISQGINRGEAAFLGESSFDPVSFSENLVKQDQQRRLAEQKQGKEDLKALIDDDFKAKWDIDAIKQFQPRIDAFRNNVVTAFKNSKGRLSPEQKILFEQEKRRIQEDVLLSNTVYDAYSSNVKKLEEASRQGGGGLDIEVSRKNLEAFKDPMSNPVTAKEVQELYGGNILKWRADNAIKYGLVDAIDREKEFGSIAKSIKPSTNFVRDEKGNVVQKYNPQTGSYEKQMITEINPKDFEAKVTEIYTTDSYKNKKLRDADESFVESAFSFDPQTGDVLYNQNDPLAVSVFQGAEPIIKGMTDPKKIKKELAKEKTRQYLESFLPEASVKQLRDRRPIGRSSSYGSGGGGWDSKFVAVVTDEPETIKSDAIKALGLQGNEPFLPKNLGLSVVNPEKGDKYISINRLKPSGTTEEESLTLLNGKPIKVIGFKVDKNGKVLMDYAYKSNIQRGLQDGKEVSLIEKGYDLENDAKLLASISSAYSTADRTFNRKEFIEFLRNKAGVKAKSSAEPKTRTQAQQQNKGASASPTPKKKKLPGT